MDHFSIDAPDISTAWLKACRRLAGTPGHKAYHTMVRIADPRRTNPQVADTLDRLRIAAGKYPLETVANTLFPQALADSCDSHGDLARRYAQLYPRLRRAAHRNSHGTYFGRLVCYPGADPRAPATDQLGNLIARLAKVSRSSRWNAVYEAGIVHGLDAAAPEHGSDTLPDVPVRIPGKDTQTLDFPCLSHLSFQLESATDTVHTVAYYRSHYMFDRAYGNYLALGRLNAWVARQAGLLPGSLSVVAGVARLDCPVSTLELVEDSDQEFVLDLDLAAAGE